MIADAAKISRDLAAPKLGRLLRHVGHALGRDTLAALPDRCRTIANDILVHRLITQLTGVFTGGDEAILTDWFARHRERAVDPDTLRDVVRVFVAQFESMFALVDERELPVDEIGRFRTLAAEIERIAGRAQTRFALEPQEESLAEVDVLLENFVEQLDRIDPATAEHSRAVAAWCRRIAWRLGLALPAATHVARGGLVHDIGKLETPLQILLAPRRLSQRELAVMQEHVIAGERLLARHEELAEFVPIVRSHHERVDGRGYPDGIPSAELPIDVRIVTVADSFNAMIGLRPYRSPLLPTAAIDELRRHRGSQFDPEVVDAMLDVIRDINEVSLGTGDVAPHARFYNR